MRLENICELSSLRDEFPARQNRELIRDNRETIPPYQAGTGKWLRIDPLAATKHFLRVVASAYRRHPLVRLANSTAMIPVTKMPSKVPAPPIDATGAPRSGIFGRLSKSAPISVPRLPAA